MGKVKLARKEDGPEQVGVLHAMTVQESLLTCCSCIPRWHARLSPEGQQKIATTAVPTRKEPISPRRFEQLVRLQS